MKKLPYAEGVVFLIPLRSTGFARGVVARATAAGEVLLGYFFGPRLASTDAITLDDLEPAKAVLKLRFGDLGLIDGKWPICGTLPNWNRSEWPIPDFVRRDPLGYLKPVLVRYADDNPNRVEAEYVVEDDIGLAADSISGYGAVEVKLTKLLG